MNPILQKLGLGPADRAVILHADDVGLCHGANQAFLGLSQQGAITCGSVMVPCPWFLEAAELACQHPELDLGVHLTLTSEWKYYRWGPVSTRQRSSGLVDEQGYFHHRTPQVRQNLNVDAAETELRAQIEIALAAGIDVTHLDAHMGVTVIPELMDVYARLGLEYGLPVLIPRQMLVYLTTLGLADIDVPQQPALVEELENQGMAIADWFYISPGAPSEMSGMVYRQLIAGLQPGLTYFSMHPNAPGDIEAINPERAFFRVDEYRLLQDDAFQSFVTEQKVVRLGYRRLRDMLRLHQQKVEA